jgi:pyridoxal phosphate enzyme (YggS family)
MSYETVIKNVLKNNATLVAVSKTKPISDILDLYNKGQRHFGENRVQELVSKYYELPKDILWHQIGSLQSNKVKHIAPFIHLIHSVDSIKLINTIEKEADKNERCIDVLLQVKVAEEETKHGINFNNFEDLVNEVCSCNYKLIRVRGIMAMASFTNDMEQVKAEFLEVKDLFNQIKVTKSSEFKHFDTLSMGMSSDYELAMKCGSNMVRVGSLIFGQRL